MTDGTRLECDDSPASLAQKKHPHKVGVRKII